MTKQNCDPSEHFGGNNAPGLKCHSWCSADHASTTATASKAAGKSRGIGTAMTAVTRLVTCREKSSPLQAYLERKTNKQANKNQTDMNMHLSPWFPY